VNLPRIKHGTVAILSIDGGGVRGQIPALIVADILRRVRFLRTLTGRSSPVAAHTVFDIFAGTSTGALLTLGLTRPSPLAPEGIAEVYRRRAATIFPVSRFASVLAMRQAFGEKYDHHPFETVMAELFGNIRLSETLANVLVAAYNTDDRGPFFFKHYTRETVAGKRRLEAAAAENEDFFLRDVARATAAAPTYFAPAQVTSTAGSRYSLVDGGLVANNPALSAYVEARKLYRDARRYIIVSIGTGRSGRQFPYEAIRKWGYIDWVSPAHGVPVTAMMWDGQSESVAHALKSLPRVEYFRFNADLGEVSEEMDDARPANMQRVEALARRIIASRKSDLHRLARLLYRRGQQLAIDCDSGGGESTAPASPRARPCVATSSASGVTRPG
jgi:predicted acylesterase/phospholipase RssA